MFLVILFIPSVYCRFDMGQTLEHIQTTQYFTRQTRTYTDHTIFHISHTLEQKCQNVTISKVRSTHNRTQGTLHLFPIYIFYFALNSVKDEILQRIFARPDTTRYSATPQGRLFLTSAGFYTKKTTPKIKSCIIVWFVVLAAISVHVMRRTHSR